MKTVKYVFLAIIILPIVIGFVGCIISIGKTTARIHNAPNKVREMINAAGGFCEVLQACRQLQCQMESNGVTRIELNPVYFASDHLLLNSDYELPAVLQKMPIALIIIDGNGMFVSLTGPVRMGLLAFKDGAPEYGKQKIIDGLWFTADPGGDKRRH